MKTINELLNQNYLCVKEYSYDGGWGFIFLNGTKGKPANCVFSWGDGWEHVSVSYPNRTPTWEEMCKVKDIFWNNEECVIQYHPPKSTYVNIHPYCLHLWRKRGDGEFELPPKEMV